MSMNIAKGIYIDANYRLHYPEGASMMDNFPEELNEVVYTDHWKLSLSLAME